MRQTHWAVFRNGCGIIWMEKMKDEHASLFNSYKYKHYKPDSLYGIFRGKKKARQELERLIEAGESFLRMSRERLRDKK